jgi:DNA (cytosine-5)-methyltransferase 1
MKFLSRRVDSPGVEADFLSGMAPASSLRSRAREIYSQEAIAEHLGKDIRTVRRWEKGEVEVPHAAAAALREMLSGAPEKALHMEKQPEFTFADLFAGIGGTRLGFEAVGGRCVFTSEWNKYACQTYRANHSDHHQIAGDITKVSADEIPDHDILVAGFPCQPFSLAGVSKKNSLGRAHGFADPTQGTVFFDIKRILSVKRPKAFLLENVKNLRSHDKGKTFQIVMRTLREELGYFVPEPRVVDASAFVPQHRERIFIAGFREDCGYDWRSLNIPQKEHHPTLQKILHSPNEEPESPYTESLRGRTVVNPKYTLSDHLWGYLQAYAEKHRALGHGFGCSVFDSSHVARTLSARYHKDGSEILIEQVSKNPRRLTPRECARLMGFPDTFRIPVSDTQAYRQFGNSVVVPVIESVADLMLAYLSGNPPQAPAENNQQLLLANFR